MIERPGDPVEVIWVDSAGNGEWHDPDDALELLERLTCRSVGYLLHDEPGGIVIALGTGSTGQRLGSMAIPRVAIVKIKKLR